jgi:deoxyribodipyrimidine photolyase-related protein
MKTLFLIFGNQLFEPEIHLKNEKNCDFLMIEDYELCTYFKFHKHKLILFLASMRKYAEKLKKQGFSIIYLKIDTPSNLKISYEEKLQKIINKNAYQQLKHFEIEDKFMEKRITAFCQKNKIQEENIQSPMFLCNRKIFLNYLSKVKKPFLKTFYQKERLRLGILVDKSGNPQGGKWSFDSENRKKLPKEIPIPGLPKINKDKTVSEVSLLIEDLFPDHPGNTDNFWLPTDRKTSLEWLKDFLENRLANFGQYEDSIDTKHQFIFHSVLSPLINLGLITPDEIIKVTLNFAKQKQIPLNSLEGFIRQIIGWREFVRGIYQNFSETEENSNFFQNKKSLKDCWYKAETGLLPLDLTIQKTLKFGWNHHIERLMIIGNIMLLCEISPKEVYRWFMEMYVDSSDWVMLPNIMGMSQFADGGIFATKPYICSSNYLLKMSDLPKGEWTDLLDGLYWSFIEKHQNYFSQNPRLGMSVKLLQKIKPERKKYMFELAKNFKAKVTY